MTNTTPLDLANTDLSNLTSGSKSAISGVAMPSTTYNTITKQESGSWYTAPADGWYFINASSASTGGGWIRLNWEDGLWLAQNCETGDRNAPFIVPIRKGVKIQISYSGNIGFGVFRFYYC